MLPVRVTKTEETEDFAEAFATIIREQMEALLALPTPVVFAHRAKIAEFAIDGVCQPWLRLITWCGLGFWCPTDTIGRPPGFVPPRSRTAFSRELTPLTHIKG